MIPLAYLASQLDSSTVIQTLVARSLENPKGFQADIRVARPGGTTRYTVVATPPRAARITMTQKGERRVVIVGPKTVATAIPALRRYTLSARPEAQSLLQATSGALTVLDPIVGVLLEPAGLSSFLQNSAAGRGWQAVNRSGRWSLLASGGRLALELDSRHRPTRLRIQAVSGVEETQIQWAEPADVKADERPEGRRVAAWTTESLPAAAAPEVRTFLNEALAHAETGEFSAEVSDGEGKRRIFARGGRLAQIEDSRGWDYDGRRLTIWSGQNRYQGPAAPEEVSRLYTEAGGRIDPILMRLLLGTSLVSELVRDSEATLGAEVDTPQGRAAILRLTRADLEATLAVRVSDGALLSAITASRMGTETVPGATLRVEYRSVQPPPAPNGVRPRPLTDLIKKDEAGRDGAIRA
ncbi:MAG: hypothetical protein MH204_04130 [Fimbriimonadaceae bacterium]|nr:hypothetical protein [Fimbriimonadaceae bacterium]